MKLIVRLFIFIVCLSGTGIVHSQNADKFFKTSRQIEYVFNRFHFSPLPYDDAFSERVFLLFKKEVDPYNGYLLQQHWDSLEKYRYILDDELRGENPGAFLAAFKVIYKQRYQRIWSLCQDVYAKPLTYSIDEEYVMENKKSIPFRTESEWENHWRKKCKFGVLSKLAVLLGKDASSKQPTADIESKARASMLKFYKKRTSWVTDDGDEFNHSMHEQFFQSVVTAYDPHSMFIPADYKSDYDQELNAVQTTFGVEIKENEGGDFEVAYVMPTSDTWARGLLKEGDVLLKYVNSEKKEIEFLELSEDDVYDLFYHPKNETLKLTVRKENGDEKTVTLQRELLKQEEGIVQSWVLKGEKNIGYISLPGFYFDWFGENPSGCANDVAKEILKMRLEKIDGLILDVRNNGGGSFMEAVEMAGIFIQEGPLLYTWEQNDKPKTTKDPNRGTIYDGPLILMINGESASASEVLADILQDYNRALIVGSPSFGKGTMQITVPLDSTGIKIWEMYGGQSYSPSAQTDYVNVTNGKLYRITGQTHQAKGVVPDVLLPDLWTMANVREADYDYVLDSDTIKGSLYYKPLAKIETETLKSKSLQRTLGEPYFSDMLKRAPEVEKLSKREGQVFPLKWEKFMNYYNETETTWNQLDSLGIVENNSLYEVKSNSFIAQKAANNESLSKGLKETEKAIRLDAQLMETYRIMLDLIVEKK